MAKKKRIYVMNPMSFSGSVYASLIRIHLFTADLSQMERDSRTSIKSGQTRYSSRSMHNTRMRVRVPTNK